MANCNIIVIIIILVILSSISAQVSSYNRPPPRKTLHFSWNSRYGTTPQQVHVSKVGENKMRISWITKKSAPSTTEYGTSSGVYHSSVEGRSARYRFATYKSGLIHETVIGPLKPNTVYYYRCSGDVSREFTLKTTPAQLPINFTIAGDLGQTGWTKTTLDHISKSNYDMLLLPGDLSYADFWQPRWDSFGRMVEPLASQRPWMVTQGNHEVEKIPLIQSTPFTAYNARWHMPYEESGSPSNLFYSFDVSTSVHVIMLGSYTDFNLGSSQYTWLKSDLKKIDRRRTPWVFVVLHAPWYNSNKDHQGEKESINMRKAMEQLLYDARVDVVFTGHVHAYERFTRVFNGEANKCGPMHITIGDGGNHEGLANSFLQRQKISVFREASFGHGRLYVVNSTHAQWMWHRNQDDQSVLGDACWLTSLAFDTNCIPWRSDVSI